MFHLTIERTFSAAHAIVIKGVREPVHGHDWRVRVTVAGPTLDDDGLLVDFHDLERRLETIIAPFRSRDLNATPPFDRVNPTAELVAQHIGERLTETLGGVPKVQRVAVTEAPGCEATWVAG